MTSVTQNWPNSEQKPNVGVQGDVMNMRESNEIDAWSILVTENTSNVSLRLSFTKLIHGYFL
jgi:hypothetical protein